MDSSTLHSAVAEKTKAAGANKTASLGTELADTGEAVSLKDMTADRVTTFVRGTTAHSAREINDLISDLEALREKLVTDSSRIEQDVVEFAALNQSVINLTKIIADSVARAKTPGAAG